MALRRRSGEGFARRAEKSAELLKLPLLYALFVLLEAALVTLSYRVLDARGSFGR